MCNCLKLTYQEIGGSPVTIEMLPLGLFNGYNYFQFTIGATIYSIWHNSTDSWNVTTDGIGGFAFVTGLKENTEPCPFASFPVWLASLVFDVFTTEICEPTPVNCGCGINLQFTFDLVDYVRQTVTGSPINGRDSYTFIVGAITFQIFWNGTKWLVIDSVALTEFASLDLNLTCPIGRFTEWEMINEAMTQFQSSPLSCKCQPLEDRLQKQYDSIKLPENFIPQNRGLIGCCCEYLVLAGNGAETWKNDKTPAWIKLSSGTDSAVFKLQKNGIDANYIPTPVPFVNQPNAWFTIINWADVLVSDGIGCYELSIDYVISGISGTLNIGIYTLKPYTIQNALTTARVWAKFSGVHETDGIDFTGSGVEGTHRFRGFIGNRQPNTEIDNIIYQNREMKRVIRENLNDYEIVTEPTDECIIKPMLDVYLLSENQLFISDYNAHNHSYRYLDLPVIVSESATIEYKELSRKAVLKCKVSDKFKTNRTFY
jgi:hypothetical protein